MKKQGNLRKALFSAIEAYGGNIDPEQLRSVARTIEAGADVNARNDQGYTPLQLAIGIKDLSLARLLLQHGADVNAPDIHGSTPLHYAAAAGDRNFVLILADQGAKIDVSDQDGRRPIDWALAAGQDETIAILTSLGRSHVSKVTQRREPTLGPQIV